jgi:hypothetical protein
MVCWTRWAETSFNAAAICGSGAGRAMVSAGAADGDTGGHNVNSEIVIPNKTTFLRSIEPLET